MQYQITSHKHQGRLLNFSNFSLGKRLIENFGNFFLKKNKKNPQNFKMLTLFLALVIIFFIYKANPPNPILHGLSQQEKMNINAVRCFARRE